jgi:hypothetical protein
MSPQRKITATIAVLASLAGIGVVAASSQPGAGTSAPERPAAHASPRAQAVVQAPPSSDDEGERDDEESAPPAAQAPAPAAAPPPPPLATRAS